jgi:cytochrome c oxidase subunit IV
MNDRTISPSASVVCFAVLIALTLARVGLSLFSMGPAGHLAVGLAIGAVKAGLVALVFIHLVRGPARTWVAAALGLYWIGILISLLMTDYLARTHTALGS